MVRCLIPFWFQSPFEVSDVLSEAVKDALVEHAFQSPFEVSDVLSKTACSDRDDLLVSIPFRGF